jgi:hypothetical protein
MEQIGRLSLCEKEMGDNLWNKLGHCYKFKRPLLKARQKGTTKRHDRKVPTEGINQRHDQRYQPKVLPTKGTTKGTTKCANYRSRKYHRI